MTLETAILFARYAQTKTEIEEVKEFYHTAEEALLHQQERENPHPLTLEELKQMDGQPVWIRDLMDGEVECLRFDRIKPATYHTGDDYRFEQFGTSTGIIRWECKYGETWLAYLYPPKEATHAAENGS